VSEPPEADYPLNMTNYVVYDGNCNLCVTLVKLLEQFDQGERFQYVPMQDEATLSQWGITAQACEQGMILIDGDRPNQRWQGSDAAEEIGRRLPMGSSFVAAYRALPGIKWMGDRVYAQVRDNRYHLFGQRTDTYQPRYPACSGDRCRL